MEVLYFSHVGEHLIDGKTIDKVQGNTEILAKKIAKQLNRSTKRIKAKNPYPIEYNALIKQAEMELQQDWMPEFEIKDDIQDPVLILGYPIWFGELPNLVKSYLKQRLIKPQVIYPFCTSEGSGMGNSENTLKKILPDTELRLGLMIRGSRVQEADCAIEHWLTQLDLKRRM